MTSPGANLSRLVLALQNKPRMSNKNILHILTECVGNLDEDIGSYLDGALYEALRAPQSIAYKAVFEAFAGG